MCAGNNQNMQEALKALNSRGIPASDRVFPGIFLEGKLKQGCY